MTPTETIKALRDALIEIQRFTDSPVIHTIAKRVLAMTADASEDAPCAHVICDARNEYVESGYLCCECGAIFAAADHHAARPAPVAATPAPDDPMDWPLPCDVVVGAGTIRKGCQLRTLVARMNVMHGMIREGWSSAPAAPIVVQDAPIRDQPAINPCGGCGNAIPDERCIGCGHIFGPAAEHAKPEPVVMGLAQDEAASGKQAAKHHGDAQSNQALISVTGHFGHRQVATPAPRSDAHAKRADVASERDSFEVYWRKVDLSPSLQYQNRFEINCEGNYLYVETRLAWETWQARGQQAGAVDGEASCR